MHHDGEGAVHALHRDEGGSHEQKGKVHGKVRDDRHHESLQRNQGRLHRMAETAEIIKTFKHTINLIKVRVLLCT